MNHLKIKKTWASALSLLSLAGCTSVQLQQQTAQQFDNNHQVVAALTTGQTPNDNIRRAAKETDALAAQQRQMPVLRRAVAPYIGSAMVPISNEDKLPSMFFEPFTLDFADASKGISLGVAMARIGEMTGVPIRVQPDVYLTGNQQPQGKPATAAPRITSGAAVTPGGPLPMPTLIGADSATREMSKTDSNKATQSIFATREIGLESVDMKYKGTLASYLDSVTNKLGLSWEYKDSTIAISRFTTEMHEIFTRPGSQTFSTSSTGSGQGGGGKSSSSNSISITDSGQIAHIASIEKVIGQMIADVPGSSLAQTDGSGRIVVKTSKEVQARVRDYLKSENASLRRQVQIQFNVYTITTDALDERGINWAAIVEKAGTAAQLKLTSPATNVSVGAGSANLTVMAGATGAGSILGDSNLMLQAMYSSGYTAQHRPVIMTAQNRQWSTLDQTATIHYLAETTPAQASMTGSGTPGLKAGNVETGAKYSALPLIMDDNTILLTYSITISDLVSMFDIVVGSGATMQKIQAPQMSSVSAGNPVALRPGEMTAVSGLSRLISTDKANRLANGAPLLTGGSNSVSLKREHFFITIRPVLL